MRLQIKGRNFVVTTDLRRYAEAKLARLDKQLAEETPVEVELAEETKHGQFTAAATVFVKGQSLRAAESTSDLRASIDKLVDNLERQVVGYREKRRLERRRRTEHHGPRRPRLGRSSGGASRCTKSSPAREGSTSAETRRRRPRAGALPRRRGTSPGSTASTEPANGTW